MSLRTLLWIMVIVCAFAALVFMFKAGNTSPGRISAGLAVAFLVFALREKPAKRKPPSQPHGPGSIL